MTPASNVRRLRKRILAWGETYRRSFPWRQTNSPYDVIVAEFMLHRTQVIQVIPVYKEFMALWPTLKSFSQASRKTVERVLAPLGLRWRINMMITALLFLWEHYGFVPTEIERLKEVPGIGPYISSAVYCFSLNRPVALVDTNTVRVTGRIFGLNISGEARRRKAVIEAVGDACDPKRPREYYYSMIDLAHAICTVRNPQCIKCPLRAVPCTYGTAIMQGTKG